jgi:hypothetical protein
MGINLGGGELDEDGGGPYGSRYQDEEDYDEEDCDEDSFDEDRLAGPPCRWLY